MQRVIEFLYIDPIIIIITIDDFRWFRFVSISIHLINQTGWKSRDKRVIESKSFSRKGEESNFPPFPPKVIKKNFNNKPKQEKFYRIYTKPFRNAQRSLYISTSISISLLSSITETSHFLLSFFPYLNPVSPTEGKSFVPFFHLKKKKKGKTNNTRRREGLFFFLKTHGDSTNARARHTYVYILTLGRLYIYICIYPWNPLTFDVHGDPLADCWRDSIGRDAEIRAHFIARDPRQV